MNNINEKGSFTLETAIVIPVVLVIICFFVVNMINFTLDTVRCAEEAFEGKSCSEFVEEAKTDIIVRTFFDFIEGIEYEK